MAVAFNAIPARNPRIQWEITYPADGDNAAETHCSICMDPNDSRTILGHRIVINNREVPAAGQLVHRVHKTCLLAFRRNTCPQCELPYERGELPRPLSERLIELGKLYGERILSKLPLYLLIGATGVITPLLIESSVGVMKGFSLAFPISGALVGSLMGTVAGSLICCVTGDLITAVGKHVIESINPEDPNYRSALLISTTALSILATGIALIGMTYLFYSGMSSTLSSGALKIFNTPRLILTTGLPLSCHKAGLIALARTLSFTLSTVSIWGGNSMMSAFETIDELENRRFAPFFAA